MSRPLPGSAPSATSLRRLICWLRPFTLIIIYPSFKTEYSRQLSEIATFIFTSPTFVILYFSHSSKLPTHGTHSSYSPLSFFPTGPLPPAPIPPLSFSPEIPPRRGGRRLAAPTSLAPPFLRWRAPAPSSHVPPFLRRRAPTSLSSDSTSPPRDPGELLPARRRDEGEQEQARVVASVGMSSQPPRRPPPSSNRLWRRESGGVGISWPLLLPPHRKRQPGAASDATRVAATARVSTTRAWRRMAVRQGISDDELAPSNRAPALPSLSPPSFLALLHLCSRQTGVAGAHRQGPDQHVHGGSSGGASGAGEGFSGSGGAARRPPWGPPPRRPRATTSPVRRPKMQAT
jgi:hypothetical protein